MADRGLRLGVGLLMAGLIARHLGAEAFGWLNLAGAIMTVGAAAAQLGFDAVLVKELVMRPDRRDELIGAALVLRLVAGVVMIALIWTLVPLMANWKETEVALIRILAFGALAPALSVPALWFQARTESRSIVKVGAIGFSVVSGWRLWLLANNAPVMAFAWANLIDVALTGLLVASTFSRRGGQLRLRRLRENSQVLLSAGWPLAIAGVAGILYTRLDQVMLRWLLGADAVGVYAVATRLSETAYTVPLLMATSVAATLTAALQVSSGSIVVEQYFRTSAAIAYALTVPAILAAPWLLRLLFGGEYAGAATVAQIHLITVIFVCLTFARGRVLVAMGMTRFPMVAAILGCVVNVVLNALLIPVWGLMGAAFAAVFAHAFAGLGLTYFYAPTRDLGRKQLRALLAPRLYF